MMLLIIFLLSILTRSLAHNTAVDGPKSYDGFKSYEVHIKDDQQLESIIKKIDMETSDILRLCMDKKNINYLVPPEKDNDLENILKDLGVSFIIAHHNVSDSDDAYSCAPVSPVPLQPEFQLLTDEVLPSSPTPSTSRQPSTAASSPALLSNLVLLLLTLQSLYLQNSFLIIATETRRKLRSGFSWNAYYDIDGIYSYLRETNKLFTNITKIVKGGYSYEGRSITGLRIRTAKGNATKPAIIIESGIHAREWITPATSTYLIQQLLTSQDPDIVAMKDSFDWHIFPSINPDGYTYTYNTDRYWRKTRSRSKNGCYGADPNRNWDHNWGSHGSSNNPCEYQLYAGSKVFSEIETRSFSKYIANVENLMVYIGLHSTAQMLLVPYSDSAEHHDNYDDLVQIGKVSLQYGERVNGVKYRGPKTAAEILYKASGGSMDWVREALGTPLVYTYELRGKSFHWPPEKIPEQGEELVQMILGLLKEATRLGYF